jgi:hypothetical protein
MAESVLLDEGPALEVDVPVVQLIDVVSRVIGLVPIVERRHDEMARHVVPPCLLAMHAGVSSSCRERAWPHAPSSSGVMTTRTITAAMVSSKESRLYSQAAIASRPTSAVNSAILPRTAKKAGSQQAVRKLESRRSLRELSV